jgi:hypothetical protein
MDKETKGATDTKKPTVVNNVVSNLPLILGTIGGIGGLYYAHTQKCGFWGYVGYMVAGNIAGGGVGTVVKVVATGKE